MVVDLEALHEELFQASRIVIAMTSLVSEIKLHDAGQTP